ncbi:GntR family transcriptional regulator [Bacillus sp. MRMR6]|uniref:GntR family transcriptional regulator n=1 Tax=Bacillus sp. MRMR6 TaxID=1928617 RepID=UPI0009510F73|nr:GntR family transcriptional regulator [Bacillus sp. MRMR6]OLS35440.1 GntR family transcriptional regulator [Bacillus sp. MRMR6]
MGSSFEPDKSISLYVQVKDTIIKRIQEKEWIPNTMIPTENELMAEFNVSRTTIRQAISILVQEGILEKKQGKGTIVKPQLFIGSLGKLKGFAEEVMEIGMVPASKLLVVKTCSDLHYEKSMLKVPMEEEIVVIERLRFADQTPIAIERSCWPDDIGKMLIHQDLNRATFYEILEKNNITLKHANEKITSINATILEADLLGIRGGQALLVMERISYGNEERPIEFTTTKFCSEKYQYQIELFR